MGPRDTANTSLIGPLSGKCFGDADAHIVSKITSLGLRERESVEKTQTGGSNKRAGSNNRSIIPIFIFLAFSATQRVYAEILNR